MLHLLIGKSGADCDLGSMSVKTKAAKLFNTTQRNYIGRLAMVEVYFDHQIGATLDYLCSRISRSSDQGIMQCARYDYAQETPSQFENASIIALTSPSGYKIGQVAPFFK